MFWLSIWRPWIFFPRAQACAWNCMAPSRHVDFSLFFFLAPSFFPFFLSPSSPLLFLSFFLSLGARAPKAPKIRPWCLKQTEKGEKQSRQKLKNDKKKRKKGKGKTGAKAINKNKHKNKKWGDGESHLLFIYIHMKRSGRQYLRKSHIHSYKFVSSPHLRSLLRKCRIRGRACVNQVSSWYLCGGSERMWREWLLRGRK